MPELSGGARGAPAGGRPRLAPLLADTQVTCGARKAGPGTRSRRCWPGRGGANPPPPAAPAAAPRPSPPAAHLRPRAPGADSRPPARPAAPAALTAHWRDCPRGRGRGGGGGRGRGRGSGLARRMGSVRGGCGSGGGRRTLDPAARAPPHARPSARRGLRLAERAGRRLAPPRLAERPARQSPGRAGLPGAAPRAVPAPAAGAGRGLRGWLLGAWGPGGVASPREARAFPGAGGPRGEIETSWLGESAAGCELGRGPAPGAPRWTPGTSAGHRCAYPAPGPGPRRPPQDPERRRQPEG
ncbi:translation initiation factor IF-2-like [Cervus elaphus]|uniref:translation initiation factor IF-2-like n=1 Tax=Cervus canadensis TaxID=1574408 RepID=UPI001CA369E7|nr:translation initiation factor IF-2-like [Cervus canadensis]XP_043733089.1 translation initiation factor IF-2-like [Cervus elaphus]